MEMQVTQSETDVLYNDLLFLRTLDEVMDRIYGTNKERAVLLQAEPTVFGAMQRAVVFSMLIVLRRLTEGHGSRVGEQSRDNTSIEGVIRRADMEESARQQMLKKLDNLRQQFPDLKKLSDRVVAHRDRSASLGLEDINFDPQRIKEAIGEVAQYGVEVLSELSGDIVNINPEFKYDGIRVIQLLKAGMDNI